MRIRDAAKYICHYSGIEKLMLGFLRNSKRPLFLTIVYHRVCKSINSYEYMGVPVDVFEEHIKLIRDNFKIVSMSDGLDLIREGEQRGIYASINFDDGYMDNYTYAFPVLKKYNLPATIFLVTDFVGKDHLFWWDEVFQIIRNARHEGFCPAPINSVRAAYEAIRINNLLIDKKEQEIKDFIYGLKRQYCIKKDLSFNQMLGWKEMHEMAGSGIGFGSQTKTHKNLRLVEDAEAHKELADSKLELEKKLGIKKTGFCYPFGKYDDRIKNIVRSEGFDYARTCVRGSNNKYVDRFALRSIDASFVLNSALFTSLVSFHSLKNSGRGHGA